MQAELTQGFKMNIKPQGETKSVSETLNKGDFGQEMKRVKKEAEAASRSHLFNQDEGQAGKRSGEMETVQENKHDQLQSRLGTEHALDLQDVFQSDLQDMETAVQTSQTLIPMESVMEHDEEVLLKLLTNGVSRSRSEQSKIPELSDIARNTLPAWGDASTVQEESSPLNDPNGQLKSYGQKEPLLEVDQGIRSEILNRMFRNSKDDGVNRVERNFSLEQNISKLSVLENESPITDTKHDVTSPGRIQINSLEENLLTFSEQKNRSSQDMGYRQKGTVNSQERMHLMKEMFAEFSGQEKNSAQGSGSQDVRNVSDQDVLVSTFEKLQSGNSVSSLNEYLSRAANQRNDDPSRYAKNMMMKEGPDGKNVDVLDRSLNQDGETRGAMTNAENLLNRTRESNQVLANPVSYVNEGTSRTTGELLAFVNSSVNTGVETSHPVSVLSQTENVSSYVMEADNRLGVLDQVVSQFRLMKAKDKDTVLLQLHPANLGKLKMHITVHDQRVVAEIMTDSTVVRDILSSQLHVLKESLMEQGLNLDRMEVHLQQHDPGNHAGHSKHDFQEASQQEWKKNGEEVSAHQEEAELTHPHETNSFTQGQVNLFV